MPDEIEPLFFTDGCVEARYMLSALEIGGTFRKVIEGALVCRAADSFDTEFTSGQWIRKIAELGVDLTVFSQTDALVAAQRIFNENVDKVIDLGVNMMINVE